MDGLKIKQLFKRYLKGQSSSVEKNIVDNWYRLLDDEKPPALDDTKEQQVKEEIWQLIDARLVNKQATIRKLNYQWLKIAASILLISSAGLLFWKLKPGNQKQVQPLHFSTVSTKAGERRLVSLPDGSLITLNSATTIRIPDNYASKRNISIIDGEAYFDVKHDKAHPFIISSGPITTQVLGTAFNIRAYNDINKMLVAVTRGKVGVLIKGKPVQYLLGNRQLVFDKKQSQITLTPLDREVLEWQKGNMVLNDAAFAEMAVLIQKNYGLNITTHQKSILSSHFTATLSTSMQPIKALEVITAIHHLKIKQRRDTIEICH
ncbi:FecR family protein [Mucilaginibacter endophyticus]|uniref:FecR family protein n=1 Tax=Mucilaginibacter endophyticus TaxID=2675003 RepID=UPI000E0D30A7|nr:FecR domain-containing protein [Mucilaginibacter endophyticus]